MLFQTQLGLRGYAIALAGLVATAGEPAARVPLALAWNQDGPGGHKTFNPPTLRGAAWTALDFHNGRAATLKDIPNPHPDPTHKLTPTERDGLKAYLESL